MEKTVYCLEHLETGKPGKLGEFHSAKFVSTQLSELPPFLCVML